MLEFYQVGADYLELLDFTQSFLLSVCRGLHGDSSFKFNGETISLEKLEIIGGVYGTGSRFLGGTGTNATKLRQLIFDVHIA